MGRLEPQGDLMLISKRTQTFVYQILYADVSNCLPEYATLKAMGYSDLSLSF
ncbi:hypothetical protein [Calothrix rhizosoleniae]|uniref:hypothetical protein n=1 Tax=Calothrix rhizosoleniae TaxID=888997 RepID=UPI00135647BF|nr:hypothetical protein [Calothrix rhizosoleniae]